jgi:hypothetical protein
MGNGYGVEDRGALLVRHRRPPLQLFGQESQRLLTPQIA